jgi:hypothetical protein
MNSLYYFAAWTDSGCLLGCPHRHDTVTEATACISCAGAYVIAVENEVLRRMNDVEEAEFQRAPRPALSSPLSEIRYEARGYAIMIRVRFVDGWGWTTWLRCDTYDDAAAHAFEGCKIMPFGTPEWTALLKVREADSPGSRWATPQSAAAPRREAETIIELMKELAPNPRRLAAELESSCARPLANPKAPDASLAGARMTFIEFVVDWIDRWEVRTLERIYRMIAPARASARQRRRRRALKTTSRPR